MFGVDLLGLASTAITFRRSQAYKTPGALYRVLSEEFDRVRGQQCSCRMPMLYAVEPQNPGDPNWRVEPLWYGCEECQRAVREIVARNAALYLLRPLPGATSQAA